jgi:tRNA wybutosine-synthesizing protein 3
MKDMFIRRKEQQMLKKDRSSIGQIDSKIKNLCDLINSMNNYYTTSSCSGRIAILLDSPRKEEGLFLFRTHEKTNAIEILDILKESSSKSEDKIVIFKQEPCIITIACRTREDAEVILEIAREKAGWKNSGIMSSKRNICELRSTEHLALPIMKNKKILVDDEFIEVLVEESNLRLEKTWEKIEKLEKELKNLDKKHYPAEA